MPLLPHTRYHRRRVLSGDAPVDQSFMLQRVQPALSGLMDGSLSRQGVLRALASPAQLLDRMREAATPRVPPDARETDVTQDLSPGQAADQTGLSRSLIYREIERGHLRAYKVGGRLRITPEALSDWKRLHAVVPRAGPLLPARSRSTGIAR
jgi:excisionase family DNA binding protein